MFAFFKKRKELKLKYENKVLIEVYRETFTSTESKIRRTYHAKCLFNRQNK